MLARNFPNTFHKKRLSFHPDFIVDSVRDIDFVFLQKAGIKAILLDLDGTIVARGTATIPNDIVKCLRAQPLKIYIATNRPKSNDLKKIKISLGAAGVIHPRGLIGKPFPRYFAQAAHNHGLNPRECVMVGDRFLQDIFGANAAGMTTVAVRKLDKPINASDRFLSGLEARISNQLAKRYTKLR